jgi:Uma2 family endonuclease
MEASLATTGPALTLTAWGDLPEDEDGELVDGHLVEEEMPDAVHELIVVWLIQMFKNWGDSSRALVLGSDAKYAVTPRRGRKPDVAVYLPGSKMPPARGVVRTPPDIAIEVVSSSPRDGRRDRVEKPEEYAAFGVMWYWIVDPTPRTLEIFELAPDGRYVRALGAGDGTVNVPGCDGLTLDLAAMWREADRLEQGE